MILTRVEKRCDHGFLEGRNCPECGQPEKRNEAKVTRKEVLIPGVAIGGSKLLRLVDDTYAEVECGGCQRPFITRRSSLIKARLGGRSVGCSMRCLKRRVEA